jgi:hypothetical protein
MADSGITVQTPSGNVVVGTDEFPAGTHHEVVKVAHGAVGTVTHASSAAPLPVSDATAEASLATLHSDVGAAGTSPPALAASASGLIGWLRKVVDTLTSGLDVTDRTARLLGHVTVDNQPSDPATGTGQGTQATKLDTLIGKDYATSAKQDTLKTSTDAITTKLTADPSTATNQTAIKGSVDQLHTDNGGPGSSPAALPGGGSGLLGYLRHIRDLLAGTLTINRVSDGTYAYAAGTAAGNVDVPTGARLKRVSVIAGATVAATVTILGGNTITVPAGGAFDDQIPGDATGTSSTSEVVIGGTVQSYYVAWVT